MSNLQQQIKQLKEELSAGLEKLQNLEEQLKAEPKHESGWERRGTTRYYIDGSINVRSATGFVAPYREDLYENNALFSNQELAEDICFEQLVYRTLRKWRDINDKGWNDDLLLDDGIPKYYIYFDGEIQQDFCYTSIHLNEIYFSRDILAMKCIEENMKLLTKYFYR